MTHPVTPRRLNDAARMQRGFGYLVGIVGSAAGTALLVQGATVSAAATWGATFIAGALLVGIATVLDGIAAVLRGHTKPEYPDEATPA